VKIGKTTQGTVKDRGLNDSNVPENFIEIWAYKVNDIDLAETCVHNLIDQFHYKSKCGRKTEFFYELAIDIAENCIVKVFKGIDVKETVVTVNNDVDDDVDGVDIEDDEKYEPDPKYNDFVSWEDLRQMRAKDDLFLTKDDAKKGWINATYFLRMTIVPQAKKQGAWEDKKISLSWLKDSGFFEKIMEIQYKDD